MRFAENSSCDGHSRGLSDKFCGVEFYQGGISWFIGRVLQKAKIEKKYEKLRILLDLCQRKYKIVRYE